MNYFITDISDIIKGKITCLSENMQQVYVKHLLIDSRKIIYPESSVFIAIKGERNDGHKYIQEVYEAGVRNFIVEKNAIVYHTFFSNDVNIIEVENSLVAMQEIATHHRTQFHYPVIGITGSNGKTVVKEWLNQLLRNDVQIVRSPKSYNSQVGVPLSVWQMNEQHQLGIFEAGISKKGEMLNLQKIIQPSIGILTFIGTAHDEGFHSIKEKLHEKLQLFRDSELLIFCNDQKEIGESVAQILLRHKKLKTFSWSKNGKFSDVIFETEIRNQKTQILTRKGSQIISINIPFTDDASIYNACSCFAFLISINRLSTDVLKRFEELQNVEMRLDLKEGINNCIIINDSYSADLNSLQIALDFMDQQSSGLSKTVILSDIFESGIKSDELYKEVSKVLKQKTINRFVGIGEQISKNKNVFEINSIFYKTTRDFIENFKSFDHSNEVILIKGSRVFQFEKINSLLTKKVHETVFEIDLNSLVHNLNMYRSNLKSQTKIMAMVKAFSYGIGSYEIAKVLEFHRVDYLTVAYIDEGITLRNAGIKTPIMVMNTEESGFNSIAKFNLEPEIYSFNILKKLIKSVEGEEVGIHIEIDCGMKRLGFEESEIDELIIHLKQNLNFRIRSVFAHLAASEDKKHDEFTQQQIFKFKKFSEKISSSFDYPILKHLLNSAGIVRFPEAQFDMVRLGIGLYGIDPSEKIQKKLHQIGKLKTVISQIRKIKSHETIGYSRKGKVLKDSIIATVAIGYADGYNRRLGNGKGYMLVNGKKAYTVGSICMDMTMLDVTEIICNEGDEVLIFGREPNINELAEKTGTIPYEILTSISQRVKRIYFYE